MERSDVTSRLLLRMVPSGPEQTITLAIRQPKWRSSSLQCGSQNMTYFLLLPTRSKVCCSSDQDDTDMRFPKMDEIGSDEMFLCFCFCVRDGRILR